jgi:hypothetical protein
MVERQAHTCPRYPNFDSMDQYEFCGEHAPPIVGDRLACALPEPKESKPKVRREDQIGGRRLSSERERFVYPVGSVRKAFWPQPKKGATTEGSPWLQEVT